MPMPRRMALAEFAERAGAYILEDNFESEFNYDAPPASSICELAPERVLSVGTFSKVIYPSVRLGYMAAPPALLARLCEHKRLSDHHTNPVYQLALAALLEDGTLEKHVRRMKREYRARRDHLTDCLHRRFGDGVRVSGGASGMNLVAAFDGVCFTEELTRQLLRHGVYAAPVERQGRRTNELVLRYSGLTKEELTLGVERLQAGARLNPETARPSAKRRRGFLERGKPCGAVRPRTVARFSDVPPAARGNSARFPPGGRPARIFTISAMGLPRVSGDNTGRSAMIKRTAAQLSPLCVLSHPHGIRVRLPGKACFPDV